MGFIRNRIINFRNLYYRLFKCSGIARGVRIYGKYIVIRKGANLKIGKGSTINNHVIFNANHGRITIGERVRISDGVQMVGEGLDLETKKHLAKDVVIEDDVWLGTGAIILPGVTVGQYSIVGAGAVVTKDVPEAVVVAGVPAKVIKEIL